jgi:hypothetical protein
MSADTLRKELEQARNRIRDLESKISASDHLGSYKVIEGKDDIGDTIDGLLAAQSKSLPPILIVLIAVFFFLLGIQIPIDSHFVGLLF